MRAYIIHPYETYSSPEENLRLEEAFYKFLKAYRPDIEYVRPFKEVEQDIPREEAMRKCYELLGTCDIAIAGPHFLKSAGCRAEQEYAQARNIPVIANLHCFLEGYKK